jgi:hypothetical protein
MIVAHADGASIPTTIAVRKTDKMVRKKRVTVAVTAKNINNDSVFKISKI